MDKEKYKFWAHIGITAGLAIFFFGVGAGEGSGAWHVGLFNTICGAIIIALGFIAACKGGVYSSSKEKKS